jgi:hypothetical protein
MFCQEEGFKVPLYPAFVDVYKRSDHHVVDSELFKDLFLADFVEANKRQEIVFGAFGSILI